MPARRAPLRRAVRQASPAAELAAWKMKFQAGCDYFNTLPDIGLDEKQLSREQIADAWRRLGRAYLEQRALELQPKVNRTPWALTEFGEPP